MKIFALLARASASVVLETQIDYFRTHFVGKSMRRNWTIPLLNIRNRKKQLKDFISFHSTAPVVSMRAKVALEPLIAQYCEFLPLLTLEGNQYFAVNVLSVVDCIDRTRSKIVYADDQPKHILWIESLAFDSNKVPSSAIFKPFPDLGVYVNESFVDCIINNDLTNAIVRDPTVDPIKLIGEGLDTNILLELPK